MCFTGLCCIGIMASPLEHLIANRLQDLRDAEKRVYVQDTRNLCRSEIILLN
jgi:hypothetical protein